MDELFGAPMEDIAAVLAVAFGLAVAYLLYIRLRDPILVRMAFRNVLRRPGQSLLILAGLMLATAIISSAFTVGDSVTYSIKNTAAASLRSVDELLVVDEDSEVWEGRALPDGFSDGGFSRTHPRTRCRYGHRRRATRPYRGRGGHKPRKPAVRILRTAGGSGPTTGQGLR